MPAPSAKARKAAVSRTPVTVAKVGFVHKRRPGVNRGKDNTNVFRQQDSSLRRSE